MSERNVLLELTSCEPTTAKATLVERNFAARFARAGVALGGCWAAAFVCIFIPLLHFILVPSLVIIGVILAALRAREDVTLAQLDGACPRCKTPRTFTPGGRYREGRTVHCDGCGNAFTVVSASPPALSAPVAA